MSRSLYIAFILVFSALELTAQEQTLLRINSKGKALEGVEVFLAENQSLNRTNVKGEVQLQLKGSSSVIWLYKQGFKYQADSIKAGEQKVIELISLETQLREVVITDFQSNASLGESVLNVRKVSLEQIEAQSAQNIEQALSHQAMLRSNRDNALNMNSKKIMGLGGENVKVLIDGVPMIGRMLGNLDLSEISSNSIQGVEIIEGPMSVIYGSNALAGAINIITKTNLGDKKSLKLDTYVGGDGNYNAGLSYDQGIGKNGLSLSAGRNFFEGWNFGDRERGWTWLPKEQYYGNVKLSRQTRDWQVNLSSRLSHAFLLDRGIPMQPYGERAIDREFRRLRADQLLSAAYNPKGKFGARLMVHQNYFEQVKNTFSRDLVELQQELTPVEADQDTQRFSAEGLKLITNYDYRKKTKFLLGFDANQERLRGPRITNGIQTNNELAIYGSYEQRIRTTTWRLGVRQGLMNQEWAPVVFALQSRIPLSDNLILRASYGRAYRIASIKERYLDFVDSNHEVYGNSELEAEDGHSYQVKLTKIFKFGKIQNSIELAAFYNDINNKIELLTLTPVQAIYQNIGQFVSQGLNFGYHLTNDRLDLRADYNMIGIDFGNGLDYSNRVSSQLMFKLPKWKTNISVFGSAFLKQYVSFYSSETGEVERTPQETYGMVDAQISRKFFQKRLSMTIGARNILDVTQVIQNNIGGIHQSGSGNTFVSNGRNFFINASFNVFK